MNMKTFMNKLATRNNNSIGWALGEFALYMLVGLVTIAIVLGTWGTYHTLKTMSSKKVSSKK